MKKLLLTLVVLGAIVAFAENTVLHVIDFETSEGYHVGNLKGQNGWTWDYSADEYNQVVSDTTGVPSGSQYASIGVVGGEIQSGIGRPRVAFDISEDYVQGNKLLVSWASSRQSGQTLAIKLHDLGTTGKSYDVEICEIEMYGSFTHKIKVSDEENKGKEISKNLYNPTDFHRFSLLLEPATRTIKEYVVDDQVIIDGTTVYHYRSNSTFAPDPEHPEKHPGDLIDGLRLQGYGAIDNFKVEMVPEPAIFGLLALLGLFFARKQR